MNGFFWASLLAVVFAGQTPATQTPIPPPVQSPVPALTPITVPPNQPAPIPTPPPAPTIVNASVNQPFTLGSLQYRVVRVTPGLASYVQQHDQRSAKLTPGFKKDRLVVVEVEVTNPSQTPINLTGIVPALVDTNGEMTNRPQWDVRQQSYVRSSGDGGEAALRFSTYLTPEDTGLYGDTTDAVMVAPGGHVDFSLVFSMPVGAQPGKVRFDTSGSYGVATTASGVVSLQ